MSDLEAQVRAAARCRDCEGTGRLRTPLDEPPVCGWCSGRGWMLTPPQVTRALVVAYRTGMRDAVGRGLVTVLDIPFDPPDFEPALAALREGRDG